LPSRRQTEPAAIRKTGAAKRKPARPRFQQLTGITVTARKREESLQTVPVAVTAYTAASLDKLDVQDLGDLDAFVPNLTVYAARGSNSTVTAYIRGVGQADPLWGVDPGVGIYLDDVYIARPQGALLDVFDVERIEVLRGPQGTLYGKNTIGGAIKYVSAPLDEDFYGQASCHRRQLQPGRREGQRQCAARRLGLGRAWPRLRSVATATARTWITDQPKCRTRKSSLRVPPSAMSAIRISG
jgi:outer membrane receptor for ferrienterochelin and colicin